MTLSLTGIAGPVVAQTLQDYVSDPKHIKNREISPSTAKQPPYRTKVERNRRHRVVVGTSYRQVGEYNRDLSRLCARGLFGQYRVERTGIYFQDDNKVVGGAHGSGWNLYDPTGKADPQQHYWFYRQGYTNCEVYVVFLRGQ